MKKFLLLSILIASLMAACKPEATASRITSPIPTTISTIAHKSVAISPLSPIATDTPASKFLPGLIYTIDGQRGLWLVNANGQPRLLTDQVDAILSPDQQFVLHGIISQIQCEPNGPVCADQDIGVTNIATGDSHNLTNTPDKIEGFFQWWPANPNLIVFNVKPEWTPWTGYLATIDADGTNYHVIGSEIGSNTPAALSPDGQTIAYDRAGAPWLYRLNGGSQPIPLEPFGLTFNQATNPKWSPDGQMLAWSVYGDEPGTRGWSGIAVLNLPQQEGFLLHRHSIQGFSEVYTQFAWSPDGKWLAVLDWAKPEASVWVIRIDGSEEYHLGDAELPIWSPDGRQLVFSRLQPEANSPYETKIMLVGVGEWQLHQLDLPRGARVKGWVTLQP